MGNFKKLAQKRLFLPVFSMILVMLINVVYDIATGSAPLSFFMISIKNGVLYGRLIDILNRGSEIAILAIGLTLVVSASGCHNLIKICSPGSGKLMMVKRPPSILPPLSLGESHETTKRHSVAGK